MKLRIFGRKDILFKDALERVMNLACVAAMYGYIPTELEIESPQQRGRYWYRSNEGGNDRFNLFPAANDRWANVKEEGENSITVQFNYRYDRLNLKYCEKLTIFLNAVFPDQTEIIE